MACALAIALPLVAHAAIPDPGGLITSCYSNFSGDLRVIDPSTSACAPVETQLEWQQGGGVTGDLVCTGCVDSSDVADGALGPVDLAFDPATQGELDALAVAGTINTATNPMDWTKLKGVPAGLADGVDDTGGTASDVVCSGCVDESDMAFDPATQSELDVRSPRVVMGDTSDTVVGGGGVPSITIGADGLPIVMHTDGGTLKLAHCGNPRCTAGNTSSVVAAAGPGEGFEGSPSSLAIGSDGLPVMAYLASANDDLKVTHCSDVRCSSSLSFTVDGAGVSTDLGLSPSITIGVDGFPIISYGDATNTSLKVAHCGNRFCSFGNTITTVDNSGAIGIYSSIAIGADGLPVISYLNGGALTLKVLRCGHRTCATGGGVTNTVTTVASSVRVLDAPQSLTIGADGLPVIGYTEHLTGPTPDLNLKVLHCGNALCNAGNVATTVDSAGFAGEEVSITIGADWLPVVSYRHETATTGRLKVLHCGTPLCNGANSTMVLPGGLQTSITIGVDGNPIIAEAGEAFGSPSVSAVHCTNPFCVPHLRRR